MIDDFHLTWKSNIAYTNNILPVKLENNEWILHFFLFFLQNGYIVYIHWEPTASRTASEWHIQKHFNPLRFHSYFGTDESRTDNKMRSARIPYREHV